MLNYTDVDDIYEVISRNELEELIIDNLGEEDVDAVIMETVPSILARAEGVVDSYLRKKYHTPLRNVTPEVKGSVLSIARYFLYDRRPLIPESVVESYKLTLKWLEVVSVGDVEIDGEDGNSIISSGRVKRGFATRKNVSMSHIHF